MESIVETHSPQVEVGTRELLDMGCGRPIGRYTLLRRIAAGGMAEVYVAFSKGLISGFEKKVAIKKILPQHSHNERFIDMLVDEAKITVSLTHPNIAQVYELGLDHEDYFIAMEYVDGRPLNRLMQRVDERGLDVIPVEFAAHIMAEVAKGLDHAHKQKDQRGRPLGIVHRDISPQNVLLSYTGDVKLIDFGIARAEGRVNQTSHGVIKGKLRYLAPEIAAGEEPDHRADVFCCGIVLFEMLTGEAMFAPKSDLEAIELATAARVKSPRSRNPKVPQDLDDIVMKALRRDRGERYQSAKALHGDLRRFLNQHYPAFTGSELADFIQQMFDPEIQADRKLDEISESVARRRSGSNDEMEEDDPTLAASPGALIGDTNGYKQIVTRLGIGESEDERVRLMGADGGRAMSVVMAEEDERPPIRRDSGADATHDKRHDAHPGTLPPQAERGETFLTGVEPTVKAENPFHDPGSVLPTITGPPPDSDISITPSADLGDTRDDSHKKTPARAAHTQRTASLNVWEGDESEVVIPGAPTQRQVRYRSSGTDVRIRRGPNLAYLMAFVGIVLALGGALWLMSPNEADPVVIAPKPDETIELSPISIDQDPPPVAVDPATIKLIVKPEGLRVNVSVDGRTKATKASTPLEIGEFAPNEIHLISVSSDGFKARELSRTLKPGQNTFSVLLRPALGSIKLKGALRGASIKSSHGRLSKNNVIEDIPLNSEVRILVEWPGTKPFRTTVPVTRPEMVSRYVPSPKKLPRGTLVVNSRPMSQVYVNGRGVGKTPLRMKLTAGTHRIKLKSPDGRSRSFTKRIRPARETKITFAW